MTEEFYIGYICENEYPDGMVEWCDNNNATIAEIEPLEGNRRFEIVAIPEPTLEEVKANKYTEALNKANLFINTEAYYRFDENNTIEATDGNIGKMTAYALGFNAGIFDSVTWTSKEDNVLTLDANDVMSILTGLGAVQANVWNVQYIAYKTAIENAITVEDVLSIVIEYTNEVE